MGRRLRIDLGRRSINVIFVREKVNFKFFPRKFRINAKKEYNFLTKLHEADVNVPKPISHISLSNSSIVIREFIDGVFFQDAIKRYHPDAIKRLLINVITELRKIEDIGIYLPEVASVYKNIIVDGEEPYIIDLERASFTKKLIIPPFLSRIWRLCSNPEIRKKLEKILEIEKILSVAKKYKTNRDLNMILEIFKR